MSEYYQPVYDAVRSRIHNGDVGSAIESAIREANLSHYVEQAAHAIAGSFGSLEHFNRPSVLYRPTLSKDGNAWCALYGPDLQIGCAGFGDTPELAMCDFDKNWTKP